jgi:branched-chain amino acid transport system ATP-binding protein
MDHRRRSSAIPRSSARTWARRRRRRERDLRRRVRERVMPMLEVAGVHASYGPIEALRGIDLEVAEGELVCVIGANGAGKTSMLRAISGVLRPRRGRIRFAGRDIERLAPDQILALGIAHCPEGRRVFPYLTVDENLDMGAWVRRDRRAVAEDRERLARHFPILAERRRQAAGTLSGGEQQMLAIARALMSRPKLLLLDEPSLGLAPTVVETTFAIVDDIRRRGTTVLMVEQNAFLALGMADRAYVMETGRITLAGPARALLVDDHVRRAYLGG